MAVLEVKGLRMYYATTEGEVKAVDGIDFELNEGEVLGIAGESGCGKSSLATTLLKLLPKNATIKEGKLMVDGQDMIQMPDAVVRRDVRWTKVAMVPQGAMNSLNPVFRVGDQITEAILAHSEMSKSEAKARTAELFRLVGIDPSRYRVYPHEFSGGMKQRAMIAMALALQPKVLLADEPTTALDVVVQAGIIRLLISLKEELKMAIILISHDLALVAQMSDKTAIMYAGKFVEYGPSKRVYASALHPYTLGLLRAFADIRKPKQELVSVPGSPPDLVNPPSGCRFNPRCPYAEEVCREKEPPLQEAEEGHFVACHFWREIQARGKQP